MKSIQKHRTMIAGAEFVLSGSKGAGVLRRMVTAIRFLASAATEWEK